MALKIRMSRGGAKKRPFFRIVVADSRRARDGRFIERLGTYDPMLPKDDPNRVTLKPERIQHWLDQGALPSYRVATFLGKADIIPMPARRNNPQKAKPKAKTVERMKAAEEAKEASEKAAAAAAAAPPAEEAPAEEAAAEAPAEEAPAEEAAAEEPPAEETPAEEAPAEEAAAEEAPAEEAPAEETPAEEAPAEEAATAEEGKSD